MPRFHGKDGAVSIDSTNVAEIEEFSAEDARTVVRAAPMGAGFIAHASGQPAWTGTVTCLWDPADGGQQALAGLADVSLELLPQGTGSGLPRLFWPAVTITGRSPTVPSEDWGRLTFTWAANSALDETAQP